MAFEPISPELVLVDPDLGARARAALAQPTAPARAHVSVAAAPEQTPAHDRHERHYPAWARVTAALWLLVIGILVGGAAIPHAQDKPRLIPKQDDPTVTVCKTPPRAPVFPRGRLGGV